MSFEPDPSVAIRIKAEAARLAEIAVDLVDDAHQLGSEFITALKDLADICEPSDFTRLVIEHLPASMQAVLSMSKLDLPSLLQMVPDLKAVGADGDAIRRQMLDRVARSASPRAAQGFGMAFPAHRDPGHTHVVVDSPRTNSMRKLVDQLLERNVGVVKDDGHSWVLCQLVLRSGYKAPGALRKHETGLLLFIVEGKGSNGQVVELEHYVDYEDIETLVVPRVAAPASSIVSG